MGNTFKYLFHVDLLTRFITKNFRLNPEWTEAVVRRCSVKKMLLEIFQDSQENTCARDSFFNKVAGLSPATLLKKSLWHRCFPVNFAKFLRTHFFTEHLRWLLLNELSVGLGRWWFHFRDMFLVVARKLKIWMNHVLILFVYLFALFYSWQITSYTTYV